MHPLESEHQAQEYLEGPGRCYLGIRQVFQGDLGASLETEPLPQAP